MSETSQIIVGICFLVVVYLLTRKVQAWRIRRAYLSIMKDLREKEALGPFQAVHLPYATKGFFRIGTRDYRPKALEYLVTSGIVGVTPQQKYYLKNKSLDAHAMK
jgi:hypothetical protein